MCLEMQVVCLVMVFPSEDVVIQKDAMMMSKTSLRCRDGVGKTNGMP